MDIIHIIIVLVILGLILYLVKTYIPMDPAVSTVLTVVVVLLLCLWLLSALNVGSGVYIGPHVR
jgi:hypothetical protein